jgi:hypothetical protein
MHDKRLLRHPVAVQDALLCVRSRRTTQQQALPRYRGHCSLPAVRLITETRSFCTEHESPWVLCCAPQWLRESNAFLQVIAKQTETRLLNLTLHYKVRGQGEHGISHSHSLSLSPTPPPPRTGAVLLLYLLCCSKRNFVRTLHINSKVLRCRHRIRKRFQLHSAHRGSDPATVYTAEARHCHYLREGGREEERINWIDSVIIAFPARRSSITGSSVSQGSNC